MKTKGTILAVIAAMAVGVGTGSGATNEVSGLLQKGLFEEEANRNLDAAIQAYQEVVTQTDKNRQFAATAVFRLGECYRKLGKTNEANVEYQRVLREFPDQKELATLSRQQLGSAAEPAQPAKGGWELLADAKQIAEIKKLSPEKRRVAVQQMFPNPVLNALMQKMTETEQQLTAQKHDYGPQHPDVERTSAVLKGIYQQIDDQVDAVLARQTSGSVSVKQDVATSNEPPADVEADEIKRFQAMLRDSPDLLNARSSNGRSRLHDAATYGQLTVARFLLDNHADVNARDNKKDTPLHLAVESGRKNMVELLLSRGAKVDAQDNNGKSALHFAAESGFKAIGELLIAHGAAVDARLYDGETPLHMAAHSGNAALAELLLANKADVNAKDGNGGTPLYMAAEMGQTPVAELLIAHHADLNAQRMGITPLMKAIAQNNTDTAKMLLQRGADVKIQVPGDNHDWPDWTALRLAVDRNNSEMARLLLEKGANVDLKDQRGFTSLIAAVNNKNFQITKLLIGSGADVNLKDKQGNTALVWAFNNNDRAMAALLLENKADPDIKYGAGKTLLIWATENKNEEFAELLLAHGAQVNACNEQGRAALHLAAAGNSLPMVKLLLAHGADVNAKDKNGNTPLDVNGQSFPGAGGPPPTFQQRLDVLQGKAVTGDEVSTLLREHGGVAEIDVATIRVARVGVLPPKIIFRTGAQGYDRHTLFELIANMFGEAGTSYDPAMLSTVYSPERGLAFPDFSKVKLVRLGKNGQKDERIMDLTKPLEEGDCSKNITLTWGDVIEIPETDHKIANVYGGLSQSTKDTLSKCLARRVEIFVKGQRAVLRLAPDLSDARTGGYVRAEPGGRRARGYAGTEVRSVGPDGEIHLSNFWLSEAVKQANVVLASSDLSRVKVRRQGKDLVFSLEKTPPVSDLWLEEGDVIEIPEKAGE